MAAASFASPQIDWDTPDPITAFARFKQKCQVMFSSDLKDTNDEEKVNYILLWSGEKGLDIFNSWTFTKGEDKKSLPIFSNGSRINWSRRRVIEFTDTHYKECDKNKASQGVILRLKNLAAKCQFRDNAEVEDRVLDQLI